MNNANVFIECGVWPESSQAIKEITLALKVKRENSVLTSPYIPGLVEGMPGMETDPINLDNPLPTTIDLAPEYEPTLVATRRSTRRVTVDP